MKGLFGVKKPYDEILGGVAAGIISEAVLKLDPAPEKDARLTDKDIITGLGVEVGVGAGISAGSLMIANMSSIFPKIAAGLAKAGAELARGTLSGLEYASTAVRGISTSVSGLMGAATIVSISVTCLFAEIGNVVEEAEAQKRFDVFLNPTPASPQDMMQTDAGRAVMMMGLMKMFEGSKF
jgi:hypothetical protein